MMQQNKTIYPFQIKSKKPIDYDELKRQFSKDNMFDNFVDAPEKD